VSFLNRLFFAQPRRSFILISALWYLALFPGRLGFDYSEAIRMMKRGESTSWWTSTFWWFLRITTFDGNTIALSSLICLFLLGFSMMYLSKQIPIERSIKDKSLIFFALTPLYGAFGVNVSHDVFLTSSIILFTAVQIRLYVNKNQPNKSEYLVFTLATLTAITTHYGIFIVLANVFVLVMQRKSLKIVFALPLAVLCMQLTSFGVTQVPTFGSVLPIIADIKCISQHEQADISDEEWAYLISKAPKDEWLAPTSCAMVDTQLSVMPSLKLEDIKLNTQLVKIYLSIVSKNSAIPAMAHIQRASVALPPPFFAGQVNQVELDPSLPIGEGTNTALQKNPGVLHPSIDESSVARKIAFLKPFEIIAQGLIFLVNQASWFWGWGGLWLWPFLGFIYFQIKVGNTRSVIGILTSTFTLHFLLLIFSAPLPRYVMSTILMGLYFGITWLVKFFSEYRHNHPGRLE
jgi:hypothetical protein